jgi:hypothetical protein
MRRKKQCHPCAVARSEPDAERDSLEPEIERTLVRVLAGSKGFRSWWFTCISVDALK